jgi:hypothetical protein
MYRIGSLLFALLFVMALQAMMIGGEGFFGSSQGGAQIQLATSRPYYRVEVVPME